MKKINTLLTILLLVSSLTACGMNNDKDRDKSDKQSITSNVKDELYENNKDADKISKEDTLIGKNFNVSYRDAIDKLKEKHMNADIIEIKLEKNHITYLYNIEAVDEKNIYKLTIDANTSQIVKEETEMLNENEKNDILREGKINFNVIIEPDEAMEIAHKEKSGIVKKWSLKNKKDQTYYIVKIIEDQIEYKVKIDAKNSKVLEVKKV